MNKRIGLTVWLHENYEKMYQVSKRLKSGVFGHQFGDLSVVFSNWRSGNNNTKI